MNWVDWVVLGIVGASTLAGLSRGAVRTVFSIVGLVVGFVAATRESGAVGMVLERWLPPSVAAVTGFLIVFLGIALVFSLAAWLLRKLMDGLALSWVDRFAGFALGLARGAAIVGILALAVEGLGGHPATRGSQTWSSALRAGAVLLEFVPEDTRERLDWERLRHWIRDSKRVNEAI
jgi:membrane protein required for colicin V production